MPLILIVYVLILTKHSNLNQRLGNFSRGQLLGNIIIKFSESSAFLDIVTRVNFFSCFEINADISISLRSQITCNSFCDEESPKYATYLIVTHLHTNKIHYFSHYQYFSTTFADISKHSSNRNLF